MLLLLLLSWRKSNYIKEEAKFHSYLRSDLNGKSMINSNDLICCLHLDVLRWMVVNIPLICIIYIAWRWAFHASTATDLPYVYIIKGNLFSNARVFLKGRLNLSNLFFYNFILLYLFPCQLYIILSIHHSWVFWLPILDAWSFGLLVNTTIFFSQKRKKNKAFSK